MKKAKLLGYRERVLLIPVRSDGHDNGENVYTFYVELDGEIFYFTFTYSFGSCFSGYTSASWGSCDTKLIKSDKPNLLITPIKDVYVNVVDGKVQLSTQDPEHSWDAVIQCVNSVDGEKIVSHTGDGGCQYYSSGNVDINESMFKVIEQKGK